MEKEEQEDREKKEKMILEEIITWNDKKAEIVSSIKKQFISKLWKEKNSKDLDVQKKNNGE